MDPMLPIPVSGDVTDEVREYVAASRSKNTRRAYLTDWTRFAAWCAERGATAMPAAAETVANYLAVAARAGTWKCATLKRWLNSIAQAHAAGGAADPTSSFLVELTWKGIRNTHGTAATSKAALRVEDARAISAAIPATLTGVRDRALLLLGFSTGLRRSELVGLDLADVADNARGLLVTVRRSKTDQEGAGRVVDVQLGSCDVACPVRAVRAWRAELAARGVPAGPVFRGVDKHGHVKAAALSGFAVALIVKKLVASIGLDADLFAGHSLRRGMATSAAAAGAAERDIQQRGGWKSERVMRRYIDEAKQFTNPAGAIL